jgi:hypothetical protein
MKIAVILLTALIYACSGENHVEAHSRFEPGQAWHYRTRSHETGSLAIVGRVEELPGIGVVVHAKLVGLSIKNPAAPGGVSSQVGHVPLLERAFAASVTELAHTNADLSDFDEGYETWRANTDDEPGAFSEPLAEVVGYIESTINQ